MELTTEEQKNIRAIGEKHKLELIVLYGSHATGASRPGSDLDIAVFGKKQLSHDAFCAFSSDLSRIFGDSPKRELDVVSLHGKDPLFLYKITKDGVLLYGNSTAYAEFRAYAFKQYFDSGDLRVLEKKLIDKFQAHLNKKYA